MPSGSFWGEHSPWRFSRKILLCRGTECGVRGDRFQQQVAVPPIILQFYVRAAETLVRHGTERGTALRQGVSCGIRLEYGNGMRLVRSDCLFFESPPMPRTLAPIGTYGGDWGGRLINLCCVSIGMYDGQPCGAYMVNALEADSYARRNRNRSFNTFAGLLVCFVQFTRF